MALLWARQLRPEDASSVDAAWAGIIGVLSVAYAAASNGDPGRRLIVAGLGAGWAFRLGYHLLADRVFRARAEDGRYRALRQHWGGSAARNFFFLYQAQAAVAVLFSLPILAAMRGGPPGVMDVLGGAVWLATVAGESVADRQLARFRAEPGNRGEVCREGLWRYSRHPNYFFEWLHWWAYVLLGRGAPLTWIGPVGMALFLFRVTGIPYTERQALKSRGDKYRRYQESTSAFVPWFPKQPAG